MSSKKSENKQGYLLYRSWTPVICGLSDSDAGQLFKAIARYQEGDVCDELGQSYLSGIFEMMRLTFDRDRAEYDAKCAMRREVGRTGGKASAQKRAMERNKGPYNQSNQLQPIASNGKQNAPNQPELELDIEKDLEKAKENTDPLNNVRLSDSVRKALCLWIEYKRERRENYKQSGLKALASRVEKAESQYGADAVINLIEDCMSSGYRGIIWDRLQGPGNHSSKQNQFVQGVENHTYNFVELESELLNK